MDNDINKMAEKMYKITPLPKDPQVAMAYVPFQEDDRLFSAEHGAVTGTMFPVLDKPFIGCGGIKYE